MITEHEARQLLIDSCHSSTEADAALLSKLASPEFVSLLVRIALDEEDYGGDAPMQAAYYLSQAPSENVRPFEPQLLALLTTANGYGGHVALALGRMRSSSAKAVIQSELGDGEFPSAWLYKEALKHYGAPDA
jgi:hypothetical protein